MTLVGLAARRQSMKRRNEKLAAAFPNGVRCQKCLQMGHWSYECKEKRKYLQRSSRTKQLAKYSDKKAEAMKSGANKERVTAPPSKRVKKCDSSSDSSSDSDSDSSSTSDNSSGSSSTSSSSSSDSDSSSDSSDDSSSSNDSERKS